MNTIKIDSKDVLMVGHRGVCGLEPENSIPSFLAACNRSYYGVETDVHVTSDGKFVVIHDDNTARVAFENISGKIFEKKMLMKYIILLKIFI